MSNQAKQSGARDKPTGVAYIASKVPLLKAKYELTEPVTGSFVKAVLTEFLTTALFLYLCTGAICFGTHLTDVSDSTGTGGETANPAANNLDAARVLTIATSFGFTIFVLVYIAAAFSGGHINPAISLGFLLAKKISAQRFLCYVVAQLVGAILGSAFVYATDHSGFHAAKGGSNVLLTGLPQSAGWLMEAILTFLLVFVVFAATDQARAQSTAHLPVLAPAGIGFAVFVCHIAAVPIDGTSINPARSFGPAVVSGTWTHHWIFWVGPFTGAIVATLLYELAFRPSAEPIKSVDYVDQHGKEYDSSRLPGYAGVSGLDVDPAVLNQQKAEETGQDIESGGSAPSQPSPRSFPPPLRTDTATDFHQYQSSTGNLEVHEHMRTLLGGASSMKAEDDYIQDAGQFFCDKF
ncbi:hypothetical protein WJX82_004240 [Trebouxia sp. C0006]